MAAAIQLSHSPLPTNSAQVARTTRLNALVYWRRRLGVGAMLVLVGAGVWTLATWVTNSAVGVNPVVADGVTEIYIVQPGDTLWSVASGLDTDGDVRDTVDRLAKLNGGSAIAVGQRLLVGA